MGTCGLNRGPEGPAAHFRIYLALLPSGPDAVRRLKLHRFRTAVQSATTVRLKPDTTDAGSNPRRRSGSNRTLLMPATTAGPSVLRFPTAARASQTADTSRAPR